MAKLVVITKGMLSSSHELGEAWATIGRADGNSFQIVESSVSGRHCEVRCKDGALLVRDLQSTNGTFVDDKKIADAVLKAGEIVRLGDVELRFEVSNAPKPPPKISVSLGEEKKSTAPEPSSETPGKFHVLFVDDSMAFLETFAELCQAFSNQTWDILTATSADRALALLHEKPVDLVVLDIGMPMVDGLQLLGIINRRYPGMKLAVMTGNATEARRADALANGAELFIEKPVTPEGIRSVFNMLNDLVSWAHREGFTGALRHVGLQEVIQMECHGRHSSILLIRNPQMRGQIYIEAGAITHAAVGTLTGESAFHKLLSLQRGEFQVKPFKAPPQRTINAGWEFLLMDAARAFDEETGFLEKKALAEKEAKAGTKATSPEPAKKPEPDSQGAYVLDEDIIMNSTDDWKPADGGKK